MAGKRQKERLDYYSMEDGWIYDSKIRRLKKKHGYKGFAIFNYILHEVFHNSYYAEYDEGFLFNIAEYFDDEEESIEEVIDYMEELNLIKRINTDHGTYLTSHGIQARYLRVREMLRRTGNFEPMSEIWLLDYPEQKTVPVQNCTDLYKTVQTCTDVYKNVGKERKGNRKERKGKETGQEKEDSDSDSELDDFTVLSDSLISRLKSEGLDVGKNTEDWIADAIRVHGTDTIKGKFEEALEGYKVGEIRNPVGWVIKQMESYMIPFAEPKPKRKKPDPDCPICHGEGGFFRKTILNGAEGAGEWVQCECTKPLQDVKEM